MGDFNVNELIEISKECGFTHGAELLVSNLEFMSEVREMCKSDRCNGYNKNWTCPPACGTLEEIKERAKQFERGLIVQTVGQLEDSFDYEGMVSIGKEHKKHFYALTKELQNRFTDCLPMGAGGCDICKKCTYPSSPCLHPERAYPSMEAYGLFVNKVCELSGLLYNNGENTVTYSSCYLLK